MSLSREHSSAQEKRIDPRPARDSVTSSFMQCHDSPTNCRSTDRRWSAERCNRCSENNEDPSESLTNIGNNISKQNHIPWETYLRSPCHRERPHNPDGRGCFCQIYALPMNFPPRMQHVVQDSDLDPHSYDRPLCSQYFSLLINIPWKYFETSGSAPEDVEVASDCGKRIASELHCLFAIVQERQRCIRLHKERQKFFRSLQWARRPGEEERIADATESFLSELISYQDGSWENRSEYIRHRDSLLLQGLRWKDLIDSVGNQELLLMDYFRSEDPNSDVINETIKNGTDLAFEACKKALLSPDLELKKTMTRLHGLLSLIQQLKETGEQSEQRTVFAQEIHRRIRAAFGLLQIVHTADPQGGTDQKVEDDFDRYDDGKGISDGGENNNGKAFQHVATGENSPDGN